MIIYNFCAKRDLKSILRNGLNKGCVTLPTETGWELFTGYIWLTLDGKANRQSWNTNQLIKYNRCARRLTIQIPDFIAKERLLTRQQLEAIFPGVGYLFDGWKGSENWRVFTGSIPPEWIIEAIETDRN